MDLKKIGRTLESNPSINRRSLLVKTLNNFFTPFQTFAETPKTKKGYHLIIDLNKHMSRFYFQVASSLIEVLPNFKDSNFKLTGLYGCDQEEIYKGKVSKKALQKIDNWFISPRTDINKYTQIQCLPEIIKENKDYSNIYILPSSAVISPSKDTTHYTLLRDNNVKIIEILKKDPFKPRKFGENLTCPKNYYPIYSKDLTKTLRECLSD